MKVSTLMILVFTKACRASEQKMHIDWNARQKILAKILNSYKRNPQTIMIAWFQLVEKR